MLEDVEIIYKSHRISAQQQKINFGIGKGHLICQAIINLKGLGHKSSKTIPATMLPRDDEPEQIIIDPRLLDGDEAETIMVN